MNIIYSADSILVEKVFRRSINRVYLSAFIAFTIITLSIVHYTQIKAYIFEIVAFGPIIIAGGILFTKQFRTICKFKNAAIWRIEVTPDQFNLETFSVSELWGLYTRNAFIDSLDRKRTTLVPHPEVQLSNSEEYNNSAFQVVCDGKGYWIDKNFFEKFVSLKFDLTNN